MRDHDGVDAMTDGQLAALAQAGDRSAFGALADRWRRPLERVIDEVLVQSEHVVVSSRRPTRGLMLEGYGVVFTFEGRLGADGLFGARGMVRFSDGDGPQAWTVPEDMKKLQQDLKEKQAQAENRRADDLAALQQELVGALLDYGATLSELGADDRVVIAAYLDGGFLLGGEGEGPEQLVLDARYGDLQRALVGDLSHEEAAALVRVSRR